MLRCLINCCIIILIMGVASLFIYVVQLVLQLVSQRIQVAKGCGMRQAGKGVSKKNFCGGAVPYTEIYSRNFPTKMVYVGAFGSCFKDGTHIILTLCVKTRELFLPKFYKFYIDID